MKQLFAIIAICTTGFLAACTSCGNGSYSNSYYNNYDSGYYAQPYNYNYSQTYYQPYQDNQCSTCNYQDQCDMNQQANQNQPAASDQDVNNQVKGTIGSGWFSKGYENVSFDVNNGVVTLKGTVNSQDDKAKIQDAVSKLKGVKQVNNQILVNPR